MLYTEKLNGFDKVTKKIHFSEIRSIRIDTKTSNKTAMIIGALVGGSLGSLIGYKSVDLRDEASASGGEFKRLRRTFLAGNAFGVIGAAFGSLVKYKYTFPINGNVNNYKRNDWDIKRRLLE